MDSHPQGKRLMNLRQGFLCLGSRFHFLFRLCLKLERNLKKSEKYLVFRLRTAQIKIFY